MKVEEDEKLKKRKERFGAQTAASSAGGAEVEVACSPGWTSINHLSFMGPFVWTPFEHNHLC